MARLENVSGLDISSSHRFQGAMWRAERVGWLAIAVLLAVAGLGLLGGAGPLLADSRRASDGDVDVRYDRVARLQTPTRVEIDVRGAAGSRRLAVSRAWLDAYELVRVVPEPATMESRPDRLAFTVDVGDAGRVRLSLEPRHVGRHRAVVWGPGGRRVEFTQVVLP